MTKVSTVTFNTIQKLKNMTTPKGKVANRFAEGLINEGYKNIYQRPLKFEKIAISGEKEAVLEAMKIAKEEGAKLVRELKTGGPFHTEKLKKASEELKKELEKINVKNIGKIPVVKNIDAKIYVEEDNIKQILANHIISPVRFKESIQTMIDNGIDTFVEVGPRKSFIRICKKN